MERRGFVVTNVCREILGYPSVFRLWREGLIPADGVLDGHPSRPDYSFGFCELDSDVSRSFWGSPTLRLESSEVSPGILCAAYNLATAGSA